MTSVAVVVVTFNRQDLLCRCLDALEAQTVPVNEIVVVDNASIDGTPDCLRMIYPRATHLRMPENLGPAGGFAEGIRYAHQKRHDWIWVFNDDDAPKREALQTLLGAVKHLNGLPFGMMGSWRAISGTEARECIMWHRGRSRPQPVIDPTGPYPVDLIGFGGLLIHSKLVATIGLPRAEYFMMFEETEYCLRARAAGFRAYVVPQSLSESYAAGSPEKSSPPWRGYYQTRNHLLMVREHRSPIELTGWAIRQMKFLIATVIWHDRKWGRIRLRCRGAWHGLRGTDGKTIDPATQDLTGAVSS